MKYLLLIVIGLTLFSCKSNNPVDNNNGATKNTKVQLLGYDYRKCMCCGGLKLSFDLNASTDTDTFYLVNDIVKNTVITDSTKFPIVVKVDWKFNEASCAATYKKVDIFKIEK